MPEFFSVNILGYKKNKMWDKSKISDISELRLNSEMHFHCQIEKYDKYDKYDESSEAKAANISFSSCWCHKLINAHDLWPTVGARECDTYTHTHAATSSAAQTFCEAWKSGNTCGQVETTLGRKQLYRFVW